MDSTNLFDTPTTHNAMRAESGLIAAVAGFLLVRERKQVRWPVAAALFAYNDLIGYVPGAIAYRRNKDKNISKGYYLAYNIMHSGLTGALVGALWAGLVRREWALLAIPLHLGGDRALFGNVLKPFSVPFEPEAHPLWETVSTQLRQPWQGMAAATAQVHANGRRNGVAESAAVSA
jgi:hypothetical protein